MLTEEQKALIVFGGEEKQLAEQAQKKISLAAKELMTLEELAKRKDELRLTRGKETVDALMKNYGMTKEMAKKLLEVDFASLPIPVQVANVEETLVGLYNLTRAKRKPAHEILNNLTFFDAQVPPEKKEMMYQIRLLYHEAVSVDEWYRQSICMAGFRQPVEKEWGSYLGGMTAGCGSAYITLSLALTWGWAFLPAVAIGALGGTAAGLAVKEIVGTVEPSIKRWWYTKYEKPCAEEQEKIKLIGERDEKIRKIQQRLDKLLLAP